MKTGTIGGYNARLFRVGVTAAESVIHGTTSKEEYKKQWRPTPLKSPLRYEREGRAAVRGSPPPGAASGSRDSKSAQDTRT
jgi:hypothetical protein